MNFGKKLLIGGLGIIIAAGIGEYGLYKKFEQAQNPIREVIRWPYNEMWTESDRLAEEYTQLKGRTVNVSGRIAQIARARTSDLSYEKSPTTSFKLQEDNREFSLDDWLLAEEGDTIEMKVKLPCTESENDRFLTKVKRFNKRYPVAGWDKFTQEDIRNELGVDKNRVISYHVLER